jgi:hypothetical protein
MGHNTWTHESNSRNLSIAILNSTSKNTLSFLLCICLFFNKISDRAVQDLAETEGGKEENGEVGGHGGEITQTMCAHVNK